MELALTSRAAEYLAGRGLTEETVAGFRLGVVPHEDPAPGHASQGGRLAIPYLSRDGHPVQIRFQCFEEHDHREFQHGKYNTVADDPARLFNVRALAAADEVIHVAEGEFDTMILNQIGLPAVGVPGARAWKPHWRRLLMGFSRIYIWGDPDAAGSELVNTITRSLRQAKPVHLRGGDVNEIYLSEGADALHRLWKEED